MLLVGMNLLWAASYPIFKFLSEQMASGALATLRFGLSALVLLAARFSGSQERRVGVEPSQRQPARPMTGFGAKQKHTMSQPSFR